MNEATVEIQAKEVSVKSRKTVEQRFLTKVDRNGPLPDQSNPHYKGLDRCWMWTASFLGNYGSFELGKTQKANRVSFSLFVGKIPDGLFVLHKCDNQACVNPGHLFVGTQSDNAKDMMKKGRAASGERSGARIHPELLARGDSHYSRTNPEKLARGERHGSRTRPDRIPRGDRNGSRVHPERHPIGERHGRSTKPERTARGERGGTAKLNESSVLEIRRLFLDGATKTSLAKKFGVDRSCVYAVVTRETWAHVK